MVRFADPELVEEFLLPYQVACCVHSAVSEALEMAGLHAPEKGGVTYKLDGEWECQCESLWVWWEDTEGGDTEFGPKCRIEYTRQFTVMLGWDLCTEAVSPCGPDFSHMPTPCREGLEEGECPEPPVPAIIEPGKCVDNKWEIDGEQHQLSVTNETAWIWAARYAIERKFPYLLQCCLRDCVDLPRQCKGVAFDTVGSTVEGNCSFTEFRVALKW